MKKILSVVLCSVILISCVNVTFAAETEYSLLNSNYVRLLGRGELIGNSRCFNWPNAGFEFEFSGTKAEVYADQALFTVAPNGSYFNVAVYDNDTLVRVTRMKINVGWNTIYEEQNGDPFVKKIMVVRSSEAIRGTVRMSKIRCDKTPVASSPRAKLIEFIGDSFTAGYGNSPELSTETNYCAENTDNWNSYTGFVARHYNADNNVIAYQGKGVFANYNIENQTDTMSHQFEYEEIYVDVPERNMSSRATHKFYKYQPQLVTIWLGTNDASAGVENETFKTAYAALVDNVRNKYPNAVVLNMALEGSRYYNVISEVVNDEKRGEKNKFYMLELDKFTSTNVGHPDIAEDRRIANQIIEKVNSISGVWDVPLVGEDDTHLLSLRANYNTGELAVFGSTDYKGDKVSLLVMKPDSNMEKGSNNEDNIVHVLQTKTSDAGEYSFEFVVEKLSGEYTLYLNSTSVDDLQEKQFIFKKMIPEISVTSGGEKVKTMSDISSGGDIKVVLSGFDVPDTDFTGMLVLAQYSNGVLEDVTLADASRDSQAYGDEVVLNTTIEDTTDTIRVFYMNKHTLAPLIGTYDIK